MKGGARTRLLRTELLICSNEVVFLNPLIGDSYAVDYRWGLKEGGSRKVQNLVASKTFDLKIGCLSSVGHLVSRGLNVFGYDQPKVEAKKKRGPSEGGTVWRRDSHGTSACATFHLHPPPKSFTIHI